MMVTKIYHFTVVTDYDGGELAYQSIGPYSSKELAETAKQNFITLEFNGEIPPNTIIKDGARPLDCLYLKDGE